MSFAVPANEAERVAAVLALDILDTPSEVAYDEIGELAAQICQTPIAYVSFVDGDRVWLKAKYGLPPDFHQCPREISFCATTVCGTEIVLVPDLRDDARFAHVPFIHGEPHLQFYCGLPLINPEGYALGTLCVMDFQPRELTFDQIESLRRLSHQVLTQLELRGKVVELDRSLKELDKARSEIAVEKARSEALLNNILPASIAEELRHNGKVQPIYVSSATILFADFKGFTLLAERIEPAALIGLLDQYFSAFDEIVARHELEKLKTIGDSYMAVGGVPSHSRRHPIDACLAALEMQDAVARIKAQREKMRLPALDLRIGLHAGPVIAGVVGRRRFTFDVWGDAVNTAALMEVNGASGRINVSEAIMGYVKSLFDLEPRGAIQTKHERSLQMFFLDRIKAEFARDERGRVPNDKFAAECNRLITGFAG